VPESPGTTPRKTTNTAAPLVHSLWADLHSLAALWRLAIIALCVGAAWYLQSAYERRILA